MTAFFSRIASVVSLFVIALVTLAARLCAPFKLGRFLATVSIPHFREHRTRTTLTVLGVSLGVAVLLAVAVVNRSILANVASTMDSVGGAADLQVAGGTAGFDQDVIDVVRDVPGVHKLTPALSQTVVIGDGRAHGERLLLLGVDFLGDDDGYFRTYDSPELDAIRNNSLEFLNSTSSLLLGRDMAERFGFKLHDKIKLATSHGIEEFEIHGLVNSKSVGTAFGGAVAIMYYPAMQVAFGRGRNIDRIDIATAKGADVGSIQSALRKKLGDSFMIERPSRKTERVEKMLGGMRTVLTMASAIALLVGVFLIYNTISIGVVQRKREIGILRALGARTHDVTRLLTLEGVLLGAVGSALGVGLGLALSRGMLSGTTQAVNELYMQVSDTSTQIDQPLLLGVFVLGTVMTGLTSAFAARMASRVQPSQAMRSSRATSMISQSSGNLSRTDFAAVALLGASWFLTKLPPVGRVPLGAFAASGALLCAGVLLTPRVIRTVHAASAVLFGGRMPAFARIANDNLTRDLARSATTTSALMVGVAMAVSFATFVNSFVTSTIEWVDQSIPADMLVTNAANISGFGFKNVPMDDSIYPELAALPGVEQIERLRITQTDYQGYPVKIIATETEIFQERAKAMMLEGTQAEAAKEMIGGAVLVSESFSRHFNVHKGDEIPLSASSKTRTFRVAGVLIDYQSDMGTIVMDHGVYVREWNDTLVDTYELFLKKGADAEAVRNTIRSRYAGRYDLFVLTNREFKEELFSRLDQMFVLMRALELVALAVAALGVVNALSASVLERMREIGVLRAVGMLRRQAHDMIVSEAALVGLAGGLAGVAVGVTLGYVLLVHINVVQTGWYFPFRVSWTSLVEVVVLAVVVSAMAAWYPARQGASMQISAALDYE